MNLDAPIFDRRNLKRAYYYFIAVSVLITLGCIAVVGMTDRFFDRRLLDRTTSWILIGVIFLVTLIYSSQRRKELQMILQIDIYEEQFRMYERYYIKKFVWAAFSLLLNGIFFIITNANLFFYMLLIQLGFSLLMFPAKRILSSELRNKDIEYV